MQEPRSILCNTIRSTDNDRCGQVGARIRSATRLGNPLVGNGGDNLRWAVGARGHRRHLRHVMETAPKGETGSSDEIVGFLLSCWPVVLWVLRAGGVAVLLLHGDRGRRLFRQSGA